jgi:hypothetical protein
MSTEANISGLLIRLEAATEKLENLLLVGKNSVEDQVDSHSFNEIVAEAQKFSGEGQKIGGVVAEQVYALIEEYSCC